MSLAEERAREKAAYYRKVWLREIGESCNNPELRAGNAIYAILMYVKSREWPIAYATFAIYANKQRRILERILKGINHG